MFGLLHVLQHFFLVRARLRGSPLSRANVGFQLPIPRSDLIYTFRFFDAGYADGHAHGRTHGLIEGRALGREKGFQLWEEIGFYEGFAKVWEAVYQTNDGIEHNTKYAQRFIILYFTLSTISSRSESHIRHLLDLVSQFPRVNPSARPQGSDGSEVAELDVAELLNKIRARYKALCAIVGVKPRLRAVESSTAITETVSGVTEIQGRRNVWKLEDKQGQASPGEMSF